MATSFTGDFFRSIDETFNPAKPTLLQRLNTPAGRASTAAGLGLLGTGVEAFGILQEGKGKQKMASFQAAILRNNAKVSRFAAAETLRQSSVTVQRATTETAQFIGRQEAAFAANGVLVGEGSAATLVSDTARVGSEAVKDIEAAAELQAWQFLVQAANSEANARLQDFAGRQARKASKLRFATSLLGGVSRFAGNFQQF